jgi:hypothetical protein
MNSAHFAFTEFSEVGLSCTHRAAGYSQPPLTDILEILEGVQVSKGLHWPELGRGHPQ